MGGRWTSASTRPWSVSAGRRSRIHPSVGRTEARVLLARALVSQPDLLLLDEPTNHLDIAAIDWLEGFLKGWQGALVFVTHDRRFLRVLATRIVEIDRGRVTSWAGDWDNYQRRREERLNAESQENARFDKLLAQGKSGPEGSIPGARATRPRARSRRCARARRARAGGNGAWTPHRRTRPKKVIARWVSFGYDGPVVTTSARPPACDRIGLIGPTASARPTLRKLLLGESRAVTARYGSSRAEVAFSPATALPCARLNAMEIRRWPGFIEVGARQALAGSARISCHAGTRARPITALSGASAPPSAVACSPRPAKLLVMDEPTTTSTWNLELLRTCWPVPGTCAGQPRPRLPRQRVTSTLVFRTRAQAGSPIVGGYSDCGDERPASLRNALRGGMGDGASPNAPSPARVPIRASAATGARELAHPRDRCRSRQGFRPTAQMTIPAPTSAKCRSPPTPCPSRILVRLDDAMPLDGDGGRQRRRWILPRAVRRREEEQSWDVAYQVALHAGSPLRLDTRLERHSCHPRRSMDRTAAAHTAACSIAAISIGFSLSVPCSGSRTPASRRTRPGQGLHIGRR